MLTPSLYQDAIGGVLRAEFGPVRHGAKRLAGLAGVTVRTAENWLANVCGPSGAALLNLSARCEAVKAEMNRLERMARGEDA